MRNANVEIPIADFVHDAHAVLKSLKDCERTVVITEQGEPSAVVVSVKAYERAAHERDILLALARGEKDIAAVDDCTFDELLAEADVIVSDT